MIPDAHQDLSSGGLGDESRAAFFSSPNKHKTYDQKIILFLRTRQPLPLPLPAKK